jgi:hypothetical protein
MGLARGGTVHRTVCAAPTIYCQVCSRSHCAERRPADVRLRVDSCLHPLELLPRRKPLLELFQFAVEVGTLFLDSRLDFPGGPFGDLGRHLKLSFTHLKFSFTD